MIERNASCLGLAVPLLMFLGLFTEATVDNISNIIDYSDNNAEIVTTVQTTTGTTTGARPIQLKPSSQTTTDTTTSTSTQTSIETTVSSTYATEITEGTTELYWPTETQNQDTQTEAVQQTESCTEQTEETISTQTITVTNEYENVNYDNAIFFKNKWYEFEICQAVQSNVDKYDIIQDSDLLSSDKVKYFFGHNTRSFIKIDQIEVGETITVRSQGNEVNYSVVNRERGKLVNGGIDIELYKSGQNVINHHYEKQTIVLITCATFIPNDRWVVIATVE